MTVSKVSIRFAVGAALMIVLISGSPLFAGEVIHKGVDLWMTVAGFAQTSFAEEPLPAGFFCESSQPFTGTVKEKYDRPFLIRCPILGNEDLVFVSSALQGDGTVEKAGVVVFCVSRNRN